MSQGLINPLTSKRIPEMYFFLLLKQCHIVDVKGLGYNNFEVDILTSFGVGPLIDGQFGHGLVHEHIYL